MTSVDWFPHEIAGCDRAVLWRYESRGSKRTKVPLVADGSGRYASVTDPTTWRPFPEAWARAQHGEADGSGIVLAPPLAGLDLDDCRDPKDGAIADWAQRILQTVPSYTETSPSSCGVKVFARVTRPLSNVVQRRPQGGAIELYVERRYFTVTGRWLASSPRFIRDCTPAISVWWARLTGHATTARIPRRRSSSGPPSPSALAPLTPADEAVLQQAKAGPDGVTFDVLYRGKWRGLRASQSEADLTVIRILARHTHDPRQLDRLFRASNLMRQKWDESRGGATYGQGTIRYALERTP